MERRGSTALPAPSLAFGRLPRRSQDLARARARRPPWPRQYEDPGLPDSGRHQPQAAGCRSPCACSALDRPLEHIRDSSHRFGPPALTVAHDRADRGIDRIWRLLPQRPHDTPLPGGLGKELCGALGKPDAGIRGDQPDPLQPAFLEMLEESAPASLVLLRPLANAENLPVAALIHADRNQQRDVAYLAGPAALEHDAVKINIRVLALDRTIAPGLDRPVDLLV